MVGHEEAIDTLTIKVNKVEEPEEPIEEPEEPIEEPEIPVETKGCQAGMSLWYLLIPLALIFIRRKKY